MNGLVSRACAVLLLAMVGVGANAATITFDFIAEVKDFGGAAGDIQDVNDAGVVVGTSAIGSLTITTDQPNVGTNPSVGIYVGAVTGLSVTLGGQAAVANAFFNDVYVLNDGPEDIFLATTEVDFGGALQDGLFGFQLRDSGGDAWGSTDIPLGPFNLGDFDTYVPFDGFGTAVYFGQAVNGNIVDIWAEIKFMEAKVIPLPAAVWLFGFALASLAGLRRR